MAVLMPLPKMRFFDADGNPLVGGKVYTYQAGTSTPLATYTNASGSTPNANPVILDADGEADIWLGSSSYKVVLKDSSDVEQWTVDNIAAGGGGTYTVLGTGAITRTVESKLREIPSIFDFGAVGNGVANDAAALTNGLQVATSFLIPWGTFLINLSADQVSLVLSNIHKLIIQADEFTINLPSGVTSISAGDIAKITAEHARLKIVGATPLTTTVTGVSAVSGSTGNWSVTYTVADGSGIAIGDVLKVDNVTPGHFAFATGIGLAASNQLRDGVVQMGTMTTSGTTCTLSLGNQNTYLAVGDLVTIKGQTRTVASLAAHPAKTFTINSALDSNVSGLQYWYYSKPNTGTCSTGGIASTTITFSSAITGTELNVDDLILVDGQVRRITGIVDDFNITVTHNITITAGTVFSIITGGLLHEGSFSVTAVAGNSITVTNRSRLRTPPLNKISGGTVTVIKTVLKNTGTGNGFNFSYLGSLKELKQVALQGNSSSSGGIGLLINGSATPYPQQPGFCTIDNNCAVIEWKEGVNVINICTLYAYGAHFCNNFGPGVSLDDGSSAYLRNAVISHNNSFGLFLGSGAYARFSEGRVCGNSSQGIRLETGATVYGDFPWSWGNTSHGVMLVGGGTGMQWVGGASCANGANGLNLQNGPSGRFTGSAFLGNATQGVNLTISMVEATQIWVSGTQSVGIAATRSYVNVLDSAATGNLTHGLQCTSGIAQGTNLLASRNLSSGIRADGGSAIFNGDTTWSSSNTVADYNVGTGGFVRIASYANSSATFGTALNTMQSTGGVITDGNPYSYRQRGHFYQTFSLGNNVATSFDYTGKTVTVYFHSSSSSSLQGAFAGNTVTPTCVSLYGTGFAVTTGPLTGTTGGGGAFTVSAANDGRIYFENRTGSTKSISFDVMGDV